MTTDYNGNPIAVKEPTINIKVVNAGFDLHVRHGSQGKSSISHRTNSMKVSQLSSRVSQRFDPKKNLLNQFQENL